MNIPIAYLNRFCHELPNCDLIVLASNTLEKNIGVRLLSKKGFRVSGYTIISENQDLYVKRSVNHGV